MPDQFELPKLVGTQVSKGASKRLPVLCLILASFISGSMFSLAAVADTPMPVIPKGKGDKCMDDTDVMRKSHMDKLLHKRDQTMYQGIRSKQFSLKQCISCHVVSGDDNKPVNASNPKHFCRVCHDYTSVKIDCFECHASKPRPKPVSHMITPASDTGDMSMGASVDSTAGTGANTPRTDPPADSKNLNTGTSTGSSL